MIKLSDYIVKRLEEFGVRQAFLVTGGGAMHLNDSFGRSKRIKKTFNHHEQACAIAAEGYARLSGKIPVVNVTTGPGGLNTLTGIMGQWTDSVPCIYISGQVKYETTTMSCPEVHLRQLGDQEINIVEIVSPLTKYAEVLKDPYDIKYVLEKALFLTNIGRPGPVWIDIPMNVQGSIIDENNLVGFNHEEYLTSSKNSMVETKEILKVLDLLTKSTRPILIAGHGIRIAKAKHLLDKLIKKVKIPIVTTFNGFDLVPSDSPYFVGRIGTLGTRAGNFAIQNSDLIISIGSRNNIRQISYDWKEFGKNATKVIVDIDETELKKPTLKAEVNITQSADLFIQSILDNFNMYEFQSWEKWLKWCIERRDKYPVVLPEYKNLHKKINPYYFIYKLTETIPKSLPIIAGNGTACVSLFQAGVVKKGQRVFWNSGCASMGYDLPASIGACLANNKKDVVCIAGDGSLQMNIQELITVAFYNLPLKIFYLNNEGYVSIRQTQSNFFNGRITGADESSGVGFPDIIKVSKAFGIKTYRLSDIKSIDSKLKEIIAYPGPVLCEVILAPDYIFAPKVASERLPDGRMVSKPLEDMYPFLEREEFLSNMIIKPIETD